MNSKLHAVCNGEGKPVLLLLSSGQMSDYKGAAQLLDVLPKAKELLADRGDDATWFRNALLEKGITPCIPSRGTRDWIKALPCNGVCLSYSSYFIEISR